MDPAQSSNSFFSSFNFQRIVILIAIIMLIVSMVFIGHALYKQSTDVTWPPKTPKCPDYWTVGGASVTDDNPNGCKPPGTIPACEYNGIPAGPGGKKLTGCP
jgi:hypothetical protein